MDFQALISICGEKTIQRQSESVVRDGKVDQKILKSNSLSSSIFVHPIAA